MALKAPWPTIDPGEFRHVITFLNPVASTDSSGSIVSWQPSIPPLVAYAKIEAIRGSEVIKSGQEVAQLYLTITTWFRQGTLPNRRLQAPNGSQYIIQAVENVLEMNTFMVLTCLAVSLNQ